MNTTNEYVDTVSNRVDRTVDNVRDRDNDRDYYDLPDGSRIHVRNNGMESQMLDYVKSDRYKNASNDDLRSKWFEFDNIRFEHASATELMDPNSDDQLDNVAAILKNYPDTKVRIAGYADKTGTDAENMKISEARANTVKKYLVAKGINASRISTEGFGEEKATVAENASDRDRSRDRDIAIHFVK